jgi:inositol transport system substrate-binding protein
MRPMTPPSRWARWKTSLAPGMDAVAILPVDTTATGPMTKAIVKAGKPLVYVNRKPEKLPKGVVYMGSNSIDAGVHEHGGTG